MIAIAVMTVPALYNHAESVSGNLARSLAGVLALGQLRISDDEHAAMVYLDHARDLGGVLAPPALSLAVPEFTGRGVFVGHFQWEPPGNQALANAFFGSSTAAVRRAILVGSRARFVLLPCGAPAALPSELAALAAPVWRRGCVSVYEMRAA